MRPYDLAYAPIYFITFRTYGTWLHGDPRQSIDRDHNVPTTARIPENPSLELWELRHLTSAPVLLSDSQRQVAEDSIHSLVARKRWHLFAVNVRTNHAHTVVGSTASGDRTMNALKAAMTSALRRASLIGSEARVWARHGSIRTITREEAVARAADYTAHRQGRGGFFAGEW